MSIKTYLELIHLPTFEERFKYLQLKGFVGKDTFGHDRYLNQVLYHSPEWRKLRRDIILRDEGRDLACDGYDIYGSIIIHHLNPITVEDVLNRSPNVFDPNNLVCTSDATHKAIHYGDIASLLVAPVVRTKNDTCPWRH